MGRHVFAAGLALAFLLGLALRLAPLSQRHLAPEVRDLGASRWVVDDPGTALHLRRVELALAEGRVPQHDPFLAHPGPAEIPALPVYDALLAGSAERWLARVDGDPSLAGVDEADLEAFAAWTGPVLYAFGFAALAWAAWIAARGSRAATLTAAAVLALAPAAVAATEVGRLDAAAPVLVLLALLVRSTQVAVRAPDALSAILEALLGGVVAGLITSISAAGVLVALPTAVAFLVRARRGPTEARPIAVRAGLLFCLVAAFVSRLPLADGPWEHVPDGLVARWALAASDVLLLSAAPFALLLLTAPRDASHAKRSFARMAALAAMLALLVFELPRAWSAMSGPVAAWWSARDVAHADAGWTAVVYGVTVLSVAGLALAVAAARTSREPSTVHLSLLAVATAALAFVEPATAPLFAVAGAVALAGAFPSFASRGQRVAAAAIGALGLLPGLVLPATVLRRDAWDRENTLELVSALRWIRANVPAGGPFNSSSARSTWGILAAPAMGELVAYHARRPVLASRSAALSHPALVREAERLALHADPAEIVGRMHAHQLRLAVASGLYVPLESGFDPPPTRGLVVPAETGLTLPGATLLRAADGRVYVTTYHDWPVAVVWSVDGEPAPRTPTVSPPR